MIDILFVVWADPKDNDFFERFKHSYLSLHFGTFKAFRVCVVDASLRSVRHRIQSFCANFDYLHVPRKKFIRAWALNVGMKELVTADIVKISDADLVYCQLHLQKTLNKMQEGFDLVTNAGHRLGVKVYSHDLNYLLTLPVDPVYKRPVVGGRWGWTTPGTPMLTRSLFFDLNGFDEEYIEQGCEDSDFIERAKVMVGGSRVAYNWDGVTCAHLWHERVWETGKNRRLLKQKMELIHHGKVKPGGVNPAGYGLL